VLAIPGPSQLGSCLIVDATAFAAPVFGAGFPECAVWSLLADLGWITNTAKHRLFLDWRLTLSCAATLQEKEERVVMFGKIVEGDQKKC